MKVNASGREKKFHFGECAEPASVVRQMAATESRSLRANKKIRQHWSSLVLSRVIASKSDSRSPRCLEVEFHARESAQFDVHSFSSSSARRRLGVRHRTEGEFVFINPVEEGFAAGSVMFVRRIHPRNDDRRINEDHGRVRRNNSAPEIFPSHFPPCSMMCFCAALGCLVFLDTNTCPLPRTDHSSTEPGPIPAFFAIFAGMVALPFDVTVSSAMTQTRYGEAEVASTDVLLNRGTA